MKRSDVKPCQEIFKFEIPEAYAEPNGNDGITVTLHYPPEDKRVYTTERRLSTEADIEFGIKCLEGLLRGDRVRIGTPEHPSRPASGGILDVFFGRSFLSHRRDGGTKVHPWYNGIPSGFPSTEEDFKDISLLQRREGAEESIVMDNENRIVRPYNTKHHHTEVMRQIRWNPKIHHPEKMFMEEHLQRLGLKNTLETRGDYIVDYGLTGPDLLKIKNTAGDAISKQFTGYIYLSWELNKL